MSTADSLNYLHEHLVRNAKEEGTLQTPHQCLRESVLNENFEQYAKEVGALSAEEQVMSNELPSFDGNTKDDESKVSISRGVLQYFPRALRHVAVISQGGAAKYDWDGWSDVPEGITRYRDAQARHENDHNRGETFCPDHSRYCVEPVRHLGQVAWNALAVLELILREAEEDEEPIYVERQYKPAGLDTEGPFYQDDDDKLFNRSNN